MRPVRQALFAAGGAIAALAAVPAVALAAPTIESESASHVTSSDATLEARINTQGLQHGAYYQFQLVTNPGEYAAEFTCPTEGFPHGSSLCLGLDEQKGALPISFAEGGVTGKLVTLDLASAGSSLSPSTTYHYRVITAAAIQTEDTIRWEPPIVYGADQTFTTPAQAFATTLTHYENTEVKLGQPNAVAVDPTSQDFWVAESAQDRVLEFNSARKYARQFGEEGTGNGQFKGIGGIATNKLGDVYVIDTGNRRVQEFSKEGEYITQFPAGLATAIAVDSEGTEGNVWVDDWGPLSGSQIAKFSPSGTPISHFGSTGSTPGQLELAFGLTISGQNIYVAELGRVQEFSSTGKFEGQFDEQGSVNGKSNLPWGIAADPTTGNLYVSEVGNNRVQEFSAERAFITAFGSPGSGNEQLSGPQGLAVNSSGNVYVADTGNRRIQEWTATKVAGEPPTFATTLTHYENTEVKLGQPNAVAVDPTSQDFWVAESAQDRVLEFNSARKYARQFGEEGTGNGQFKGIGGIATNKLGDVYVIDTGNRRVQEFSKEGEYITQFPAGLATAIAVDSEGTEGNVWVDDWGPLSGSQIAKFSPSGTPISHFGSTGSTPGQLELAFGLTISGQNIYVAELGRVQEFSSTGKFEGQFDEQGSVNGKSNLPWGIAADPTTGNLYVSEVGNNRVQEFSAERAFITAFGSPGSGNEQHSGPQGLAVNSSGNVYVADTGNNRVQEWVPTPVPPKFAGLKSATTCIPGPIDSETTSSYHLTWEAATDNVTPPSQVVYNVYQATKAGGEDFSKPTYTTAPGVTSFDTPQLPSDKTFYFVVRARDQAGNEDSNTIEKEGQNLCV